MNKFLSIFGVVATVLGGIAAILDTVVKHQNGDSSESHIPTEVPLSNDKKSPKYVVQRIGAYTGEVLYTDDEIFDNEEDAKFYAEECSAAFAEGEEVLELADRTYECSDDSYFVVTEIEE